MEVCHHYLVSHSEFLKWPKVDRDKALWWMDRLNRSCSRCGTRPEEWDPEQGGHRHAYTAEPQVCMGCRTLQQRESSLQPEVRDDPAFGRGLRITLKQRAGG